MAGASGLRLGWASCNLSIGINVGSLATDGHTDAPYSNSKLDTGLLFSRHLYLLSSDQGLLCNYAWDGASYRLPIKLGKDLLCF